MKPLNLVFHINVKIYICWSAGLLYVYVQHVFAHPHREYAHVCVIHLVKHAKLCDVSSTLALALAGHWTNLQGANEEPRASVCQPNNFNIFRAANLRGTNR